MKRLKDYRGFRIYKEKGIYNTTFKRNRLPDYSLHLSTLKELKKLMDETIKLGQHE